jgi:hypothetical protein
MVWKLNYKSMFYVFVQVYGNLCTRILHNEAITQYYWKYMHAATPRLYFPNIDLHEVLYLVIDQHWT